MNEDIFENWFKLVVSDMRSEEAGTSCMKEKNIWKLIFTSGYKACENIYDKKLQKYLNERGV